MIRLIAAAGALVALLLWRLCGGVVRARSRLRVDGRRRGGWGEVVEGFVQAEATVEAPLSGAPCVAFRVTGRAGGDQVDDAGLVPFTVVTDGGERVRVLAAAARVRIRTRPAEAGEAARRFLAERGLRRQPLVLAEGLVRPGDRVRVSGAPTQVADPRAAAGYRGAVYLRAIAETAAVELEVRRVAYRAARSRRRC